MSRSRPWRRVCPEQVKERIGEALQSTMFILHQTGPTGFVLKKEGSEKNFKVMLGDLHQCNCSTFKKESDLCIHILWLLLKRFKIPSDNAIIHQLGLVEREIDEVILGQLAQGSSTESTTDTAQRGMQQPRHRKPITKDDVCPICQEELLDKRQRLTFCKFGCGKSIHLKCMKVWADHRLLQGEKDLTCPLCRENFGTFRDLCRELHTARRAEKPVHASTICDHCRMQPIAGKCYKCSSCPSLFLCHRCFLSNHHPHHSFQFRQHPSREWLRASRPALSPALPAVAIIRLQERELTENDYELLSALDRGGLAAEALSSSLPAASSSASWVRGARHRRSPLSSLLVEVVDSSLLSQGSVCRMCSRPFALGDWAGRFLCQHKFHRSCAEQWLREGKSSCPVDGISLTRKVQRVHRKVSLRSPHVNGHEDDADVSEFSVTGVGIGQPRSEPPHSISERCLVSSNPVLPAHKCQVPPADACHLDNQKAPTITDDFSLQATPLSSFCHPVGPALTNPLAGQRRSFGKPSPLRRKGLLLPAFGAVSQSTPTPQHSSHGNGPSCGNRGNDPPPRGDHGNSLPRIVAQGYHGVTVLRQQPKLAVCNVQIGTLPTIATNIAANGNAVQPLHRAPCL